MATTKVSVCRDARKHHPWVVRWFGEYDPATDKQRRYSKSFRLKREAEQFQASKQAELDKGGQRDRLEDITVGMFCKEYLDKRMHEWAAKTRSQIEDLCNRIVAYFGGGTRLRAITPTKASAFWSCAKNVHARNVGDELSRFTKNRILRDSKTMFRYAVDWEYLVRNPFSGMKLLRVPRQNRKPWHYLKPTEYLDLLRVAPDLRWKTLYALAYTTGARLGELFSLTENSFDLSKGCLIIKNRSASDDMPPFHVKDHEERQIRLPMHTLKLVVGWLKHRPEGSPYILLTPDRYQCVLKRWREYRAAGKPWINDYMVNNVNREIKRHVKWAGIQLDGSLSIHCFRKACGQNWANQLPMNVVKELMGHADIGTTAEFYSTVTEEQEFHAQWVIDSVLKSAARGKTDAKLTPEGQIRPFAKVG